MAEQDSQPLRLRGEFKVASCLFLSELVNGVTVDFAVWVTGQEAGARYIYSEYKG